MDWLVIIVVYAVVFTAGGIIAIIHELGHAFAYLLLTKPDKVDVYIGSYGHPQQSFKFTIGKLNFNVRHKFFFIRGIGLCSSSKAETDYIKKIVILLAGPLFTFLVMAAISLIVVGASQGHLTRNGNILVYICCGTFMYFSAASLIVNLVPSKLNTPFRANVNLDNDGSQIAFTLNVKKALPNYVEAIQYNIDGNFEQGSILLKQVLAAVPGNQKILRDLYKTLIQAKLYDEALLYITELERHAELQTNDILQRGCLQSATKRHDEAIVTYQLVLKKDRNNLIALNNLGAEMVNKGAHIVAEHLFKRAVKLGTKVSNTYAAWARSKIIQSDMVAAKPLIDKSLELDNKNAEAWRVSGIYYLKLKDAANTDASFNKAIELDSNVEMDDYMQEWKELMESAVSSAVSLQAEA